MASVARTTDADGAFACAGTGQGAVTVAVAEFHGTGRLARAMS
jgi:hypothetical protein